MQRKSARSRTDPTYRNRGGEPSNGFQRETLFTEAPDHASRRLGSVYYFGIRARGSSDEWHASSDGDVAKIRKASLRRKWRGFSEPGWQDQAMPERPSIRRSCVGAGVDPGLTLKDRSKKRNGVVQIFGRSLALMNLVMADCSGQGGGGGPCKAARRNQSVGGPFWSALKAHASFFKLCT